MTDYTIVCDGCSVQIDSDTRSAAIARRNAQEQGILFVYKRKDYCRECFHDKILPPENMDVWRTYAGRRKIAHHNHGVWYTATGDVLGAIQCVDDWKEATQEDVDNAWRERELRIP